MLTVDFYALYILIHPNWHSLFRFSCLIFLFFYRYRVIVLVFFCSCVHQGKIVV